MSDDATLRGQVTQRVQELRDLASDIGAEGFRDGGWFARLLNHALRTYAERVDAAWFREKYPNLPADVVAEQRIALAKRYAMLAGSANAAAYSGAIAATIGSGGGASGAALPAGIASFAVDLLYLTDLQLKLAHDLSILYDHPVDLDDPEDLFDLLRVAFGIKASEAFRTSLSKLGPEAVRVGVKNVVKGSTLAWMRALPVVGKHLLQRNVIKFAIPLVNVPLAGGMNWYFTGKIGASARDVFRLRSTNVQAANRIAGQVDTEAEVLLRVLTLVVQADGKTTRDEALFLQHLATLVDLDPAALQGLGQDRPLTESAVIEDLRALPGDRRTLILEAATAAAEADGHVHRKERRLLTRLEAARES